MKIETLEIAGIMSAIHAMRLPMKSGARSDSGWGGTMDEDVFYGFLSAYEYNEYGGCYVIGPKDHKLSMKLCKAGSDHRKHLRLIDVYAEIKAPLFWWKEFDTYRFGVEKVSESTMHTLMKTPLTLEDFEVTNSGIHYLTWEDPDSYEPRSEIESLERLRQDGFFDTLNAVLPQSYLQTRICKISYEALRNMYHARRNHKLEQWHQFCDWIEGLPYAEFIVGEEK